MATSTPSELMVVRAAAELRDKEIIFVGIGLPNLACNLARATHAPNLVMIYESGTIGTIPERLPVSIGDPALVTNSLSIVSQADVFQLYLQAGLIEVGFLGGAQVDRYGNINSTVIGSYANPKVRLPGSGGACEIAVHAQRLLVIITMNPKTFVEKCDFVTSPGHLFQSKHPSPQLGKKRCEFKLPGPGPETVISDLGVLKFVEGEMVLTETYQGVQVETAKSQCGWPLKVASQLKVIDPPEERSLKLLREKLDPKRLYL